MNSNPVNNSRSISLPVLALVCFVTVFFARSVYTVAPELGGDALRKWQSAKILVDQHDLGELVRDRHHSARWGVNYPLVAMIEVVGFNLTSYILLPLLLYAGIYTMLMGFAWRKPFCGAALAAAAVLLFYEPMFFRASSQPQPFVFGIFFLTAALWAMSRYLENGKTVLLLFSALLAFLAYGAKETYFFFYPGLFLLLYFRGNFRACVIYAAALLLLLVLETIMFNIASGQLTLGRIEYLFFGHHLKAMYKKEMFGSYSILDFVGRRWITITTFNQVISAISILYFLYLLGARKLREIDTLSLGVFLLVLSYCFVLTFIPLKLNPLLAIQPLHQKYMTTVMPYFAYCTAYCLNDLLGLLGSRRKAMVNTAIALVLLAFVSYSVVRESPLRYNFIAEYPSKKNFFWNQDTYLNELNQALDQGYGICVQRWRVNKTLSYWLQFYLDSKQPGQVFDTPRVGKLHVVHLDKHDVTALKGFIQDDELDRIFAMPRCDMQQLEASLADLRKN
jgi:hypothetical protein